MGYEVYEGFENGALLLTELSKAAKADSEGGASITMSEIVKILATVGVQVVADVQDGEPGESEE